MYHKKRHFESYLTDRWCKNTEGGLERQRSMDDYYNDIFWDGISGADGTREPMGEACPSLDVKKLWWCMETVKNKTGTEHHRFPAKSVVLEWWMLVPLLLSMVLWFFHGPSFSVLHHALTGSTSLVSYSADSDPANSRMQRSDDLMLLEPHSRSQARHSCRRPALLFVLESRDQTEERTNTKIAVKIWKRFLQKIQSCCAFFGF